jgi:hypothetical protein
VTWSERICAAGLARPHNIERPDRGGGRQRGGRNRLGSTGRFPYDRAHAEL